MLIVSQDRSFIVNFNNVEAIEIGNIEENQDTGTIYAKLVSDYFYKLGEYKIEERAKEVLQEIIKKHKGTEALKIAINRVSDNVGAFGIENTFVYEMPEE